MSARNNEENVVVVGRWSRESILGSGAFGVITLWRNVDTDERIALKQCKWAVTGSGGGNAYPDGTMPGINAITPKHKERWKQEVYIMHKLDHPNVVKAIKVPDVLEVPSSLDMPSLGMEYCSGGDLRQVLNKPQNCCGLGEKSIRSLLSQIASAILYLHSNRIIHRDLKPENIVIQIKPNGEHVYKLIDLGYCKQLDQSSLCTSFVGTLQYLAPELFLSKQYTSAVDNWSFGLLSHEIITGRRPFLPHLNPTQWIPIVSRKRSDHICAVYDAKTGEVSFSKEVSPFNHITKPLKENTEVWLRTMFQWDPRKRNGKDAFVQLEKILSKKIIRVFVVNTLESFSYEINPSMQLKEFRVFLDSNCKISSDNQFLMIRSPNTSETKLFVGDDIKEDVFQVLHNQCVEHGAYEVSAYLMDKSKPLTYSPYSTTCILPAKVEEVLLNPTALVTFDEQKNSWKQFIWSSIKIIQQYNDLMRAHDVLHNRASQMLDMVLQQYNFCNIRSHQVFAVQDFFKEKIRLDFIKLRDVLRTTEGIKDTEFFLHCQEIFTVMKSQQFLDSKIKTASLKLTELFNGRRELLSSPRREFNYNPMDPDEIGESNDKDSLQIIEIYRKILHIFDQLRRKVKEERIKQVKTVGSEAAFDNTPMVKLLCDLFQIIERHIRRVYVDITKLRELIDPCKELMQQLESVKKYLVDTEKLKDLQLKYEEHLWEVLKLKPVPGSDSREKSDNTVIDEMVVLLNTINFAGSSREASPMRTDSDCSGMSDWTILS